MNLFYLFIYRGWGWGGDSLAPLKYFVQRAPRAAKILYRKFKILAQGNYNLGTELSTSLVNITIILMAKAATHRINNYVLFRFPFSSHDRKCIYKIFFFSLYYERVFFYCSRDFFSLVDSNDLSLASFRR